ncbi:uncharacterized protein TNCV_938021 [Trichonephila clavipes]|nr:uncharacterized protein TNCV_938021 [Trichonephila clavipes]
MWLAYDILEHFQMFPDQSYSALVLRSQAGEVLAFKDYFTRLDIKSKRRNPWFREYWEHGSITPLWHIQGSCSLVVMVMVSCNWVMSLS